MNISSHTYNIVTISISRYVVKNIVIFFILLPSPYVNEVLLRTFPKIEMYISIHFTIPPKIITVLF